MSKQKNKELLIIIPAYNESESIEKTIHDLTSVAPEFDYLIVNDGSTDNCLEICRNNNYNTLDLPVNLGLAGAVQAGYRYAIRHGYKTALQYDGDGQHRPGYINQMLEQIHKGHDIVIGSRFVTKKKPMSPRMLGSRLISLAIRIVNRKKITDPTSGMRMVTGKALKDFAMNMNRAPEPDTIAHKISEGYSVIEIQVEMNDRMAGSSYLTIVRSMRYMMNQLMSIVFIQPFRKKNKKGGSK